MALTKARVREILSAAGVDTEHLTTATNSIIEGHVSSIEALRDEISDQKSTIEQLRKNSGDAEGLQKELDKANKQIKELEALKEKADSYEALKTEFENYKTEQVKKETDAVKATKFRELLKDIGLSDKGIQLALKWQGVNGVELDEDGKIANAKELKKSAKEDWKDYITTTEETGADTNTPPAGSEGTKLTKEEIMKIKDRNERQEAWGKYLESQ